MEKARYTLLYNRENRLNSKRLAPIHIEVYFNRESRKFIHTNIKIEPEYWDEKKRQVSSKHPQFINYNHKLKEKVDEIEAYEFELINRIMLRGKSSGRSDDQDINKVNNRIKVYKKETLPVATYYEEQGKLNKIVGVGSVDNIFSDISEVIESLPH